MKLSQEETHFLTALAREQNQTGCRGPAHDLLRNSVYSEAPLSGPRSLEFAYEAVPLIGILLRDFRDLQEIDDFLRRGERFANPEWPWSSPHAYRSRLAEARIELAQRQTASV